jgi:hypothetical protein
LYATRPETLPEWNDANGRTIGEVVDALRMTAKTLRNDRDI